MPDFADIPARLYCIYIIAGGAAIVYDGEYPPAFESMKSHTVFFDHAFLPEGWRKNVRITVSGDRIAAVETEAAPAVGERVAGIALPGMPNVHCHSFQRAMAGLAERRGPANDSFWTWREIMYRFLDRLTPDDVEAITAFAYMEMLERGFTAVGEFHYLHHAPDGSPYADLGEMAARIVGGARQTGIGLTMLPSFYRYGTFGGAPAHPGQRRFLNSPDRFNALVARTREIAAADPSINVGIAPHSLRAVTPEDMRIVVEASPQGPIHIHAAEQVKEVEDCLAWSGKRPVEWLLDEMQADRRWCLIHSTHMTDEETLRLARAEAVAGLCPLTEASLGDGIFNAEKYLPAGGRFGIGTDSNIDIDAALELRQLEYSQRLKHRGRNLIATVEGESNGARLFVEALRGGAQALDRPMGSLEAGKRADIVVLDDTHPDFASAGVNRWLDAWIFVAGRGAVQRVMAGGEWVVKEGQHVRRESIRAKYSAALKGLAHG
jgi:formimidoylglutamate deiminase